MGSWAKLHRIDQNSGAVLETFPANQADWPTCLTFADGELFGLDGSNFNQPDRLIRVRPGDGRLNVVGLTGFDANIQSIESDPRTSITYAVCQNKLYTLDRSSGAGTLIADLHPSDPAEPLTALAINHLGEAYVVGVWVYKLEVSTGQLTKIGRLSTNGGLVFHGTFRDWAFDANGQLWGTFYSTYHPPQSGLYKIDLLTLKGTKIVHPTIAWAGLAFGPNCEIATYCTGKYNSLLCMPVLSTSGHPMEHGADDFVIRASNELNQKLGVLMWGRRPEALPFAGGTLCIQPPLIRTPIQNSGGSVGGLPDCSGVYAFHFSQSYMAQHQVHAGEAIFAQYWSRDPGYAPPDDVGLTDAVRFVVCP